MSSRPARVTKNVDKSVYIHLKPPSTPRKRAYPANMTPKPYRLTDDQTRLIYEHVTSGLTTKQYFSRLYNVAYSTITRAVERGRLLSGPAPVLAAPEEDVPLPVRILGEFPLQSTWSLAPVTAFDPDWDYGDAEKLTSLDTGRLILARHVTVPPYTVDEEAIDATASSVSPWSSPFSLVSSDGAAAVEDDRDLNDLVETFLNNMS